MDSSRRAVEAYWRSRMVDGVTTDEDKVAPVYKLEEICELLRTSHASIVKEVSDFILKRVDHKSPVVKQKALRLIKYAVGKSGTEFRREMQRHSAAMRQLVHYKGHPDLLKGDALNKAVRETAQEAISAIFASDDNKVAPTEGVSKRIEGFGNTNFETPSEDKRSFLSEVVGFGGASIKQGLSTIAAAHSSIKNDSGSYKSPNLRRSLTTEKESGNRYEGDDNGKSWASPLVSTNSSSGTWSQSSTQIINTESSNGDAGPSNSGVKTCEERLLETIVTSGGVRIQPTRDAIQVFLSEASKLNPESMCHALESKLQSNLWQVRMKAICVLESMVRKKGDANFSIIASYFSENKDYVLKCSESPQVSLREKATKVLSLLEDKDTSGTKSQFGGPSAAKEMSGPTVSLPDLIDTREPDDYGHGDSIQCHINESKGNLTSTGSLVDDLFGSEPTANRGTSASNSEDPFADVSFHVSEDREEVTDLFSGLTVDERRSADESKEPAGNHMSELLDVFGSNADQVLPEITHEKKDVHDLMTGFSIDDIPQENKQPGGSSRVPFSGPAVSISDAKNKVNPSTTNEALNGVLGSQLTGMNLNAHFPVSSMQNNIAGNIMFNQPLASQPINYGAMGNFIAQQQFLYQNLGGLNAGILNGSSTVKDESYSSPIPDIFQLSSNPVQSHSTVTNSSKKEETKAFDFISECLSTARGTKRVL